MSHVNAQDTARKAPKAVESTSHISFNENDKTFRLYAGESIYAFCISPELALEHLHWGEAVPAEYDLRYLGQSSRLTHFTTVEAAPDPFGGKIVLAAETLEEIQRTWRENKVWVPTDMNDQERFHKARLENFSWRVMTKLMSDQARKKGGDFHVGRRFSSARDISKAKAACSNSTIDRIPIVPKKVLTEVLVDELGPPSPTAQSPSTAADHRRAAHPLLHRAASNPNLLDLSHDESMRLEHTRSLEDDASMTGKDHLHAIFGRSQGTEFMHESKKVPFAVHNNVEEMDRKLGKVGKGGINLEYSDHGTGDFRTPSFMVVDNYNGSSISPLRYRRHKIYKGKLAMPDYMPGIRCLNDSEASTLVVTMADAVSGLEVDIIFVCMHNYDCITRRVVFRNVSKRNACSSIMIAGNGGGEFHCGSSKVILKASSFSIDFEAEPTSFHLVQLSGSWARERYKVETKLTQGVQSLGSMRGVSSHQHNPFAAISFGAPNERHGEVRGFALVYSGNFLFEAELGELGRLRINMGIHPMGMSWHLQQGETFATPEAVLVRSSNGLGGMSRTLHRLVLDRLIPKNWSDQDPPILLNTWEAKYFHINHDNIVDMAHQAAKVGINLIVVDDGWFGKRDDDSTSLGDWVVDLAKFPHGIKGLAEEVNALGLKFGLWFEPEMVSEQSALFTAHPDWYLHVPGRPRQIGRNQMVLDLSRKDVRDYLFNALCSVLSGANIEYMKWDMNRPLTEVYSIDQHGRDIWQTEIGHRYVLGVYELQARIIAAFPNLLLEACASGGGRFDLGMLYYSPQIWCSDNTDALVRMRIQYGTSLAYPARCIGAHVSVVPNHLTGNTSRLRTRGFVAMCGTFGYELDLSACSAADRLIFQRQCEFYRQIAPIVRWGDIYRLWDPFKRSLAAWMYVTRDKSQAVVFAFSVNSDHWSALVPRLPLQGLDPDMDYVVTEPLPNNVTQSAGSLMIIETTVPVYQLGATSVSLRGKILMTAGLPVKFYTLDDSVVFLLTRADGCFTTRRDDMRFAFNALKGMVRKGKALRMALSSASTPKSDKANQKHLQEIVQLQQMV